MLGCKSQVGLTSTVINGNVSPFLSEWWSMRTQSRAEIYDAARSGSVETQQVQALKIEKARARIDDLTQKLYVKSTSQNLKLYRRVVDTMYLIEAYQTVGDTNMVQEKCREVIQHCQTEGALAGENNPDYRQSISQNFFRVHVILGRYSFHHYLIAMEWLFPPEMKFYTNRYIVMADPTRVETANVKYATDIKQRRTGDDVKELHIATRWSVHDVVSTIEYENEDNPKK